MRWRRRLLSGREQARRLEAEYDDARAVLALAHGGDATLSAREVARAEAIVDGYPRARLTPDRPLYPPEDR